MLGVEQSILISVSLNVLFDNLQSVDSYIIEMYLNCAIAVVYKD